MNIEKELVRRLSRRRFLVGIVSVFTGSALARAALLSIKARDQQPGVGAGTGPGVQTHASTHDAGGSDELSASIVRRGTVSITIAVDGTTGTVDVTLDPALTGATSDYLLFTTLQSTAIQTGVQAFVTHGSFTDLSTIRIRLVRSPRTIPDLADTSTTESGPDPHTHDWPVGNELLTNTGLAAITLTVAWMIMRA